MSCVFCEIVAGRAPASIIHHDDTLMAFMALRPTAPGECMIIPKAHIDHFTDIPDNLAHRIILLAQRIGRRMRAVFSLQRVGFLVHGYGVPHAHLIIVPQQGPYHLTSDRFAQIVDGRVVFDSSSIPVVTRTVLDDHARILAGGHVEDGAT